MQLPAYPEYKDSGVPWLGEIPAHWEFLRAKSLFATVDVRSKTGQEELLSVSERRGISPRKNLAVTMFQAASYVGHKLCWPGDLVVNSLWAWMGGLGFSDVHGIVSSAYGVYRPKSEVISSYHYYNYLLRSQAYKWELRVRSKGVWRSRYQIRDDDILTMPILVPGSNEQKTITDFLNWKTSQINKFIRNKRRLIALLKEQKQNIINKAVTRGINPDAKFKPSGVDWIGDIPEHWEETRAKYFFQEIDNRSQSGTEEMLSVSHLTGITPRSQKNVTMFMAKSNVGLKICQPGDIVINTMWAWMAALGVSMYHGIVSPSYGVYRQLDATKYDLTYLDYLLRVDGYRSEYIGRSTGVRSSRLRLYPDKFLSMPIICPPITEQKDIVSFIAKATSNFDATISRAEREIQLMAEYRDRLIADVVTGKVDVRGIAVPDTASDASQDMGGDELADPDFEDELEEATEAVAEEQEE